MTHVVDRNRMLVVDTDAQGDLVPVSGAKLYFYEDGTTTPRTVYTDVSYATPHTQPLVTDAAGQTAQVFINPTGGNYRLRITDSSDVVLYDDDNLSPGLDLPVSVANGGTGATSASAARTALDVPSATVTDGLDTRLTAAETFVSDPKLYAYDAQAYAATFTADYDATNAVSTTLTGNVTVAAPDNVTAGQLIVLQLAQDATGSRTISFNAAWKFSGGAAPKWSTTANAVDVLWGIARSSSIIDVIGVKTDDSGVTEVDLGTYATGTLYTHAHNTSDYLAELAVYLECTTADSPYAVGERVQVSGSAEQTDAGNRRGIIVSDDGTTVRVRTGATTHQLLSDTGTAVGITAARWKFVTVYKA